MVGRSGVWNIIYFMAVSRKARVMYVSLCGVCYGLCFLLVVLVVFCGRWERRMRRVPHSF